MTKLSRVKNFIVKKLWPMANLQLKWNLKNFSTTTPKLTNVWLYSPTRILNEIEKRVKMCSCCIIVVTTESYQNVFNILFYI